MKLKKAIATTVAALAAVAGGVVGLPAAHADEPNIRIGSVVRQAGRSDTALVQVEYRCPSYPAPTHLWVSVKQEPKLGTDGNFSSSNSDAWYDDHPRGIVCDDTWHRRTFPVKLHEPWQKSWTILRAGRAWVQFCITQGGGETEEEPPDYFDMGQTWVTVK